MVAARSLPLGAVRLTARHLRADPPAPEELRALRLAVRTRLAEALPVAARGEPLVALGGTVRALARIHLTARGEKRSRQGLRLDQPDVAALRARLEFLPLHRRRRVPGLKTERADIIVAGAIVIEDLLVFGGYPALTVCTHGVRDGLLVQETFGREA
jgi:exopolyphosphatase/guanosine-5'-triphosphate,3'-diphosphate pyrophosphatase